MYILWSTYVEPSVEKIKFYLNYYEICNLMVFNFSILKKRLIEVWLHKFIPLKIEMRVLEKEKQSGI